MVRSIFSKLLDRNALVLLVCMILGIGLYGASLTNGFVLDDEAQLVNNKLIQNIQNIPLLLTGGTFDSGGASQFVGMYYRPVAAVIRALVFSVFGFSPFPYHTLQLIIHIANAALLYLLLKRFMKENLAWFLSLLFLVHPINTEAVVYVSALQDVLVFFFGVLALLLEISTISPKWKLLFVPLLLFLSLLSKETGVFFVGMVLVSKIFIATIFKGHNAPAGEPTKFSLASILSLRADNEAGSNSEDKSKFSWATSGGRGDVFAILSVLFFYLFIRFDIAKIPLTKHWVAPISNAPLVIRLLTIPKEILYYLKTLLFPMHLSFSQHFLVTRLTLGDFFLPLIIIIFIIVIYVLIWKNLEKIKDRKPFLFFSIWFLVSLSLHLHLIPLDMTVADHWFYIPFVGLLGMAGIALGKKHTNQTNNATNKTKVLCIFVILILLSARSFKRSLDWKDGYTLYTHDIQYSPNNFDLENDLASELVKRKNYQEALIHAQRSVVLAPDFWVNWNTLGVAYLRTGQKDKAIAAYHHAIDNSDFYIAYENLAGVYLLYDTPQKTAAFTKNALVKFPKNATLWLDLAIADYKLASRQDAIFAINQSISFDPTPQAYEIARRIQENLPIPIQSE